MDLLRRRPVHRRESWSQLTPAPLRLLLAVTLTAVPVKRPLQKLPGRRLLLQSKWFLQILIKLKKIIKNAPCQNGANCVDLTADYACDCPSGWSGTNCADEVTPCTTVEDVCPAHSTCEHDGPGVHSCDCHTTGTGHMPRFLRCGSLSRIASAHHSAIRLSINRRGLTSIATCEYCATPHTSRVF